MLKNDKMTSEMKDLAEGQIRLINFVQMIFIFLNIRENLYGIMLKK